MKVTQTEVTVSSKAMALTQVYVDCLTEEIVFIYGEVDSELKKVDSGLTEKKLFPARDYSMLTIADMLDGKQPAEAKLDGQESEVAKPVEEVVEVTPIK